MLLHTFNRLQYSANTTFICAGRTAASALGEHLRDMDPTNHIVDSIRKLAHEMLKTPRPRIPSTGPQVPQHLIHTHLHPLASSQCMPLTAARRNLCRWLMSNTESWPNSGELREITQMWTFSTTLGKAKGRLSAHGLALQDQEKAYNLNIPPEEEQEVWSKCIHSSEKT